MSIFSRNYNLAKSNFFDGFTDLHCHLLPGVDDGVQTIEESLKILKHYENLSIKKVWLTPHIMEDIPNTTHKLKVIFEELKKSYKGNIQLFLGAENMIDNLLSSRLKNNDLLPIGEKHNHLLVETSYFNPPINLYGKLADIKNKGYFPVLAHPERYLYMNEEYYYKIKEMGVMFQLNLLSFIGFYGKDVKKKAEWLLKKDFYNLTGTDLHSLNALSSIQKISITKKQLSKLFTLKNQASSLI